MRTFQELHAKELANAVNANARGQAVEAAEHVERAAQWHAIDSDAQARSRSGRSGAHRG